MSSIVHQGSRVPNKSCHARESHSCYKCEREHGATPASWNQRAECRRIASWDLLDVYSVWYPVGMCSASTGLWRFSLSGFRLVHHSFHRAYCCGVMILHFQIMLHSIHHGDSGAEPWAVRHQSHSCRLMGADAAIRRPSIFPRRSGLDKETHGRSMSDAAVCSRRGRLWPLTRSDKSWLGCSTRGPCQSSQP